MGKTCQKTKTKKGVEISVGEEIKSSLHPPEFLAETPYNERQINRRKTNRI